VFLTQNGAVFDFISTKKEPRKPLALKFQNANPKSPIDGVEPRTELRNYFIGRDQKKWHTDVPTFRAVSYHDIYPGIDLSWYGNGQQLEYDFVVSAGADPARIGITFDADVQPEISAAGDLVLRQSAIELRQLKPIIYQEIDGKRHEVAGNYLLRRKHEVGFEIGTYDHTKPLVIDPTLVYSTYLGGSGDDVGSSIAIDSSNNMYIVGISDSLNFPIKNPAFPTAAGLADIFVTKIDAADHVSRWRL
jgi:hypothetical protein